MLGWEIVQGQLALTGPAVGVAVLLYLSWLRAAAAEFGPAVLQLKEETERLEEEEGETRKKLKATREHTKQWEQTRETRARSPLLHTLSPLHAAPSSVLLA